jgi:hypothetical protein
MHTNVMENCYKLPSCNVGYGNLYYLYLTSEIAKWELNVWFSFMSVLLENRNEMLGFLWWR